MVSFLNFLKIGLVGFGGGIAVLAQIRALTVRQRRWLTDSDFAEAVALAQALPGTSAGNSVRYIGLRLRGWRGATVAMSGFILPSMLIIGGFTCIEGGHDSLSFSPRFLRSKRRVFVQIRFFPPRSICCIVDIFAALEVNRVPR